jgi:CRP-like cAMP-binding protein
MNISMSSLFNSLDCFLDFKSMTRSHKTKLFKGIELVEFCRHQILYDEGQPSDAIYLLIEGEYEVTKNFSTISSEKHRHIEF